ncbi:hypothetical protein SDRG_07363, partial [Saprolegnia diclina VS20]
MFLRHTARQLRQAARSAASRSSLVARPWSMQPRTGMRFMSSSSAPAPEEPTNPLAKAFEDKERFFDWDLVDIFAQDVSLLGKMAMFVQLHAAKPHAKTPLDVPDFMDGAKSAIEMILRTVYTPAFFAAALDPAVENDEVNLLRSVMGPKCVETLMMGFSELAKAGCTKFDLTDLEVKNVGLSNVLLKDGDDEATKSVLLQVEFTMVEHVTTTMKGEDGVETQKDNVRDADCTWVFESDIVNGEPTAWTVVQIA